MNTLKIGEERKRQAFAMLEKHPTLTPGELRRRLSAAVGREQNYNNMKRYLEEFQRERQPPAATPPRPRKTGAKTAAAPPPDGIEIRETERRPQPFAELEALRQSLQKCEAVAEAVRDAGGAAVAQKVLAAVELAGGVDAFRILLASVTRIQG